MTIVLILHQADLLPWYVPLFAPLKKRGFRVIIGINTHSHLKPQQRTNDKIPQLTSSIPTIYFFFSTPEELVKHLAYHEPKAVLTVEGLPFIFDPLLFQKRSFWIHSLIHSVDNLTPKGVANGVIDTVITPYQGYAENLNWKNVSTLPLGNPKYDVAGLLQPEEIRRKYQLPEKYILLFAPNYNLVPVKTLWHIVRFFKKAGYAVVLKGKWPKCHRAIYRVLADHYFLTEKSFYPFIVHELLTASSGAVGFDTTAAEEALMFEKPLINLAVKPYRQQANFKQYEAMWKSAFCLDINFQDRNWRRVTREHPEMLQHFLKSFDYTQIQKETYLPPEGAAERIADFLAQQPNKV